MPQADSRSITPALPRALTPSKRKRIETRIEELISVLDAQDAPAEDLEDSGDDEPDGADESALGWTEDLNQDRAIKNCTNDDAGVIFGPDREADDSDSEPSLGSLGCTSSAEHFDQRGWAGGSTNDAEGDEHDGREPDVDGEPELGWPEQINQARALKSCASNYVMDRGNLHGYGYVYDGGEPSLGSCENINQTSWGRGPYLDLEQEHDGREDESEDEGAQVD